MTYKFKNSLSKPINFSEETKGSIFVFYSKLNMTASRGVVMTSIESIEAQSELITHWTPNCYSYGTYIDKNNRITKGHSENNLRQINTFYVDIDSETVTDSDILLASLDLGFMPTLILKTDRGLQAYFVLETPAYVTKHNDYKVVKVAKMISKNIRNYFLKAGLPVDRLCNHFGIARFPNNQNVTYYDANQVYSFEKWLNWSMKQDDYQEKPKADLMLITGTSGIKQIQEKWFKLLLMQSNIKGKKGQFGRNNVLFTLALACFSSGLSQYECEARLAAFNTSLAQPLTAKEYQKIITSAYSGEYVGASRDYILMLCHDWVNQSVTYNDLFTIQKWRKFKKKRVDRIRSHYYEWEKDLLMYLNNTKQVYIEVTKKHLIEALNIPSRTLDIVLKRLSEQKQILLTVRRGRYGGIKVAVLKRVCIHVIGQAKAKKEAFLNTLSKLIDISITRLERLADDYIERYMPYVQPELWDVDIGEYALIS